MTSEISKDSSSAWLAPRGERPKKPIARPLYPERVIQRDRETVLRGLLAFLTRYGYWPARLELTAMLDADPGAVSCYLEDLQNSGLIERAKPRYRTSFWQLTPSGWSEVGLAPLEPWIRRPRRLLSRIAHRVTVDLADLEAIREKSRKTAGRDVHAALASAPPPAPAPNRVKAPWEK